jgi:polar amino acid transport system substrate-binding protein
MKLLSKTMILRGFIFFIGSILFLNLSIAQAREWSAIKDSGHIYVATEGAFYPFNYFEGSKITGFEVELAELIVKEMGLAIEWQIVPFDAQLIAMRQDRYDFVIASHSFTPERAAVVDFGNFHYCTGGQIASWNKEAITVKDLAGKTVAVQLATSYAERAKAIPNIGTIKTFSKDTEAFMALKSRKVDAWISDRFLQKTTLQKYNEKSIVSGELIFQEKIGALFKKGNTELLDHYNQALTIVIKNGDYRKVSEKYFQEDISCH